MPGRNVGAQRERGLQSGQRGPGVGEGGGRDGQGLRVKIACCSAYSVQVSTTTSCSALYAWSRHGRLGSAQASRAGEGAGVVGRS